MTARSEYSTGEYAFEECKSGKIPCCVERMDHKFSSVFANSSMQMIYSSRHYSPYIHIYTKRFHVNSCLISHINMMCRIQLYQPRAPGPECVVSLRCSIIGSVMLNTSIIWRQIPSSIDIMAWCFDVPCRCVPSSSGSRSTGAIAGGTGKKLDSQGQDRRQTTYLVLGGRIHQNPPQPAHL